MKIIFNKFFLEGNYILFGIFLLVTIAMIIFTLIVGYKEVKK